MFTKNQLYQEKEKERKKRKKESISNKRKRGKEKKIYTFIPKTKSLNNAPLALALTLH